MLYSKLIMAHACKQYFFLNVIINGSLMWELLTEFKTATVFLIKGPMI